MTKTPSKARGPLDRASTRGISADYEDAARRNELPDDGYIRPRDGALPAADDTQDKNPNGEAANPAPYIGGVRPNADEGPGPNSAGNSKGDGSVDPQGQQGGLIRKRP